MEVHVEQKNISNRSCSRSGSVNMVSSILSSLINVRYIYIYIYVYMSGFVHSMHIVFRTVSEDGLAI